MKKKKTTEMFKELMFVRDIVPSIKFIGSKMLFPYTWNGERVFASIDLKDLQKIVKWDIDLTYKD